MSQNLPRTRLINESRTRYINVSRHMDVPRTLFKPPYRTWLALNLWMSHTRTCHELDLGMSHQLDVWVCLCHDVWMFHKLQEPPYQKWLALDLWMSHIRTCHELDLGRSHELDIWMCLFHKLQEPPYQKWLALVKSAAAPVLKESFHLNIGAA